MCRPILPVVTLQMKTIPALLLLALPAAQAQPAPDLSGHWEGSIRIPGHDLAIELDLAASPAGALSGTFSSSEQHLTDFPLANFRNSNQLQVRGAAPGERVFTGSLSDGGRMFSGDFAQLGYNLPFQVSRTGEAHLEPPLQSPALSKQLAGTWKAETNGSAGPTHLTLTLTNQPDGSSTGVLFHAEEGLEIPVRTITQSAVSVTLDLQAIGGSFKGELNRDGTELAGSYSDASGSLPVIFRRVEAASADN